MRLTPSAAASSSWRSGSPARSTPDRIAERSASVTKEAAVRKPGLGDGIGMDSPDMGRPRFGTHTRLRYKYCTTVTESCKRKFPHSGLNIQQPHGYLHAARG